jgi:transposase-like protein
MTPTLPTQDTQPAAPSQAEFQALLHAKMRLALRVTLIDLLEDEVTAFIGVPHYQRGGRRRDQRNGAYARDLGTTVGLLEDLPVPRTRRGFRTQLFERYQRRQAQLDAAIGEMFVFGASMVRVGEVVETLTGLTPSPSTVSRVFHKLDTEFEAWKQRPLAEHYAYVFADGTYFTIIYDGEGAKTPVLAVVGIRADGTREVLAFAVGERENQAAWADLFADLKRRGLKVIDLTITDGGQAMLNALAQHFPTTPRQRCAKHKIENVLSYVPEAQQALVEPELKAIFYQDDRAAADREAAAFRLKFAQTYPSAIECLDRDWEACLTFYAFPKTHWRTIRTNNVIERLFGEVKKRTHKMAAPFQGEASCLLMFYAVIRSLTFRKLTMPTK